MNSITKETRDSLAAMSIEDIVTTIQVAGNDDLFVNAIGKKATDALVKKSIEHASEVQEKTDKWPTFEEWLQYRAELFHAALKEAGDVAGEASA